jgi:hypothetical protein
METIARFFRKFIGRRGAVPREIIHDESDFVTGPTKQIPYETIAEIRQLQLQQQNDGR